MPYLAVRRVLCVAIGGYFRFNLPMTSLERPLIADQTNQSWDKLACLRSGSANQIPQEESNIRRTDCRFVRRSCRWNIFDLQRSGTQPNAATMKTKIRRIGARAPHFILAPHSIRPCASIVVDTLTTLRNTGMLILDHLCVVNWLSNRG